MRDSAESFELPCDCEIFGGPRLGPIILFLKLGLQYTYLWNPNTQYEASLVYRPTVYICVFLWRLFWLVWFISKDDKDGADEDDNDDDEDVLREGECRFVDDVGDGADKHHSSNERLGWERHTAILLLQRAYQQLHPHGQHDTRC